ncbi:MAG: hypothetical protein F6K19_33955 [Cyanothece sp. SIO1E1]|nr:hypothetical protein [Cyanothece sp. SIO1E1]
MALHSDFEPCQIVCLEHEAVRLYAEIVQVITERHRCWLRPLMLADYAPDSDAIALSTNPVNPIPTLLYDLRQSSDLLWPIQMFRPAFDTEVMVLLSQLDHNECAYDPQLTRHQFNHFIQQVWQAHLGTFGTQ